MSMNHKNKVALDAGHGLYTPGKRTPDDEREWTFNNVVLLEAQRLLLMNNVDVLRLDDPTGRRDVPLNERTDKANSWGADILVSIHHNAMTGKWGKWTGTETFHFNRGDVTKARKLAKEVHERLLLAYELYNRGVKSANFHMLRESNMPAVLTEGGFMDSRIDISKLRDNKVLKDAGRRIAQGIMAYFGKTLKEGTPAESDVTGGTLYRVQVGAFKELGKVAAFAKEVEEKTKFTTYVPEIDGWMKVQVGAFFDINKANERLKAVKAAGYSTAFISVDDTHAVPELEPQNEPQPVSKPKPSNPSIAGAKWVKDEDAYFKAKHNIKVRSTPTIASNNYTGTLPSGASIRYYKVYEGNGYRWLQYVGNSGRKLYLPYRRLSGNTEAWGTFHSERPVARKSSSEVARDIYTKPNYGGWGVGKERQDKLRKAGYDPKVVQMHINRMAK